MLLARGSIKTENPTLSEVAQDLRQNTVCKGITVEHVRKAVKTRNLPIKDGRIHRDRVADVYFSYMRGEVD
jgi:hypothetical protein